MESSQRLREVAWFLAAALSWAAVDVGQAAATSGGIGITRLAALTLLLYALLGLAAAAVAVPLLSRVFRPHAFPAAALATAVFGIGALLVLGYVNVAFLPSITNPISIAANLALVAVIAAGWLAAARARPLARVQGSAAVAAVVGAIAVAATFVVAMPAAGVAGSALGARSTASPSMPSVFVIVLDSLRADRTSLFGRTDRLLPRLEALIEQSAGYSRAYVQSSWTKPSVGSLFTSLFPSSHGATLRTGRLASGATTLPELFARGGYATAVFSSNPWVSPAFGFHEGVGHFVESERESFTRLITLHRLLKMADKALPGDAIRLSLQKLERGFGVSEAHRSNCLRDAWLVDQLEPWLEQAGPGPYFAYFHLMSPHIPYDPPGVAHEDFPDDEQVALQRVTTPLPEPRRRRLIELYEQASVHGDQMLGRILDILEARGMAANSVVVVTADHGEEFHEHGAWGHGNSLYDETIHVPLVIRSPGLSPRRIDAPVMLVDVLPTLSVLTDAQTMPAPAEAQGADIRAPDAARPAYAELTREGGLESHALIRASQKYIETVKSLGEPLQHELYDLARDPAEKSSLGSAAQADWAQSLAALRRQAQATRFESDAAEIDEDAEERLRGLGYLN
ncbi:MAG TPA: sulfatase-like hydrolase/transferase [Candidatus Limnocylindrales bacterium]|nr:sulfatase-like hydrolase/transferase [Candidatus Limnocylindrales bacterium]